jgi:hypothetical protein
MAINVNTKLFTLEEVITKLNYSKTLEMIINLEEVSSELTYEKYALSNLTSVPERTIKASIDRQLRYLALNILTFKDALDYFEINSFETLMTSMGIELNISKN